MVASISSLGAYTDLKAATFANPWAGALPLFKYCLNLIPGLLVLSLELALEVVKELVRDKLEGVEPLITNDL